MTTSADFLYTVLGLLSAVLTGFVIPWLKNKAATEKQKQLVQWAEIAVNAAEQTYKDFSKEICNVNDMKKNFVLNFLKEKGIKEAEAEVLCESAVLAKTNHDIKGD